MSGSHRTERLSKRELASLARTLAKEVTVAAQFRHLDDYLRHLCTGIADLGGHMERVLRLIEEARSP